MEKRKLGRIEFEATIVGLGGIPIARRSTKEALAVVNCALDLGINFIDTARAYGDSEAKIGLVMRNRREECFLATKTHARTKRGAARQIETSLANLQTDFLDLVQLHSIDYMEDLKTVLKEEGAYAACEEARREGKVRYIGITGHRPDVLRAALMTGNFETVMLPINFVDRFVFAEEEEKLLNLAEEMGVGVIAMKPLAGGMIKRPSIALRYALSRKITLAIPGMGTIEEVKQNVATGEAFSPLSEEEQEALFREAEELGTNFCRQCGYCLPCTVEIDIPAIFRLEGYYERYGLKEWARKEYAKLKVSVEECLEDGVCEERCPYHLPIIEKLKIAAYKLA
jgi:hypothetical protein